MRNSQRAMADVPLRRLTVTTRGLGHEIEVRIVDTGEGIATAIRPTLFEPFHTTAADGMGLGLALSRSIVQAHGGRIWSPETATGAEFRFTLKAGGRHG